MVIHSSIIDCAMPSYNEYLQYKNTSHKFTFIARIQKAFDRLNFHVSLSRSATTFKLSIYMHHMVEPEGHA